VFSAEDGGSMFLRNVGIYLQVFTTIQPRRSTSTGSKLESKHASVLDKRKLTANFVLHIVYRKAADVLVMNWIRRQATQGSRRGKTFQDLRRTKAPSLLERFPILIDCRKDEQSI
jgi:hypothetical protein